MTLAIVTNFSCSRILVFKGNYAGKTLIALNGTEDDSLRKPFEPLYRDGVYFDICSDHAEEALLNELRSGEVALVWFELFISYLCVSRGHVVHFFCRLLPSLNITDAEARAVAVGIEETVAISLVELFLFGVKRVAVFLYLLAADWFKSEVKRPGRSNDRFNIARCWGR